MVRESKINLGRNLGKKGMSLAVLIFFFVSLILLIGSLFYFNTQKNNVEKTLDISDNIDRIYSKQTELDYYSWKIFDKVVKQGISKGEFVNGLRSELEFYKDVEKGYAVRELEFLERQLVVENVEVSDDKIVLKLNFNLYTDSFGEGLVIDYSYNRELVKEF
ncbi:hypothetical protein HOD75_02430 [archaeon]|mgnify:FL=1|jgi:hypothetical protein|nr:hypothetical protein [archaeon]MBT4241735.1 hypothetical protein [archaeon]MBT4418283.1 hypothetical protein [archaeon]